MFGYVLNRPLSLGSNAIVVFFIRHATYVVESSSKSIFPYGTVSGFDIVFVNSNNCIFSRYVNSFAHRERNESSIVDDEER